MTSKKFKTFVLGLILIAVVLGYRVSVDVNKQGEVELAVVTPTPVATVRATKMAKATVRPTADVLGEETVETPLPSGWFQNEGGAIRQHAKIKRVVDGDTVELESGEKLRYIGIDTPETVKPNTPVQCFGKEASEKNKALVEGKEVELEKDVSETDRYGRLLRYVFVEGTFVNEYLVKEGYAYSSAYPPDVKYQEVLDEAQKSAREGNVGLWGAGCPVKKS
jgi:endonuclease YncB( thermonuclease family)